MERLGNTILTVLFTDSTRQGFQIYLCTYLSTYVHSSYAKHCASRLHPKYHDGKVGCTPIPNQRYHSRITISETVRALLLMLKFKL
jgi:hypothetical protein